MNKRTWIAVISGLERAQFLCTRHCLRFDTDCQTLHNRKFPTAKLRPSTGFQLWQLDFNVNVNHYTYVSVAKTAVIIDWMRRWKKKVSKRRLGTIRYLTTQGFAINLIKPLVIRAQTQKKKKSCMNCHAPTPNSQNLPFWYKKYPQVRNCAFQCFKQLMS